MSDIQWLQAKLAGLSAENARLEGINVTLEAENRRMRSEVQGIVDRFEQRIRFIEGHLARVQREAKVSKEEAAEMRELAVKAMAKAPEVYVGGDGERVDDPAKHVAEVKSWFGETDAEMAGVKILFAAYEIDGYDGLAEVIFERDGKLFEVEGSHCSCTILDEQWEPAEVTWKALAMRDFGPNGFLGSLKPEARVAFEAMVRAHLAKGEA